MMNRMVENSSVKWYQKFDVYIVAIVLLSIYIPLIGTQLYFRHDDSQTLLWAKEFTGNVFSAFNPRPWLNEYFKYPGIGGYYRPFEAVFMMSILKIFGPNAFYFHFINGLLVIGTILFMYKTAELFSNRTAAFLSVLIFHLCFHTMLYGTFHVVVPFGYFFELGCFYFTARGLVRNDKKSLLLAMFFLIPATNRQTTAVILPIMVIVYLLSYWRQTFPGSKIKFILPIVAMIPNAIIPLSSHSSTATLVNIDIDLMGKFQFVYERIVFYGSLLTGGITGFVVLFCIFCFLMIRILDFRGFIKKRLSKAHRWIFLILFILCGLLTAVLMRFHELAIVLLLLSLLFILMTHKHLRFACTWFFISMGCFLAIIVYHSAYLLEAAYGLSIVLGILSFHVYEKIDFSFSLRPFFKRHTKRLCIAGIIVLVALGVVILKTRYGALFSRKIEAAKVLVQTNKNFEDMIHYIKDELPVNSEIFVLSDEDLGIRFEDWRLWSLKDRAEKVKVMDIKDTTAMLKVLNRYDLRLHSIQKLNDAEEELQRYFIVYNTFEKDIAERRYNLRLMGSFRRGNTEAAVYRYNSEK